MPIYEIFCGLTSSLIVAPIMTIIDTAVIKTQINKLSLKEALSETVSDYSSKKIKFAKPFSIMLLVYSSTYSTANLTTLFCKTNNLDYKLPTLIATSLVNVASISYKDKEYTKLFALKKQNFQKSSYTLFAIRDMLTIASSFTYKDNCIQLFNKFMPHNTADFFASLLLPMGIQILSTPLHILAIDLYQHPHSTKKERLENIQRMYKSVCGGRILRVIPAFCIGGFINDMLRDRKV